MTKSNLLKIMIVIVICLAAIAAALTIYRNRPSGAIQTAKTSVDAGADTAMKSTSTIMSQIKTMHPEYTTDQLSYFLAAAEKGTVHGSCEGRSDQNDCVLAVAMITQKYYICGDIEDNKARVDCSILMLKDEAAALMNECEGIGSEDGRSQCLRDIFSSFSEPADCSGFADGRVRALCEGAAYYNKALFGGNKALCGKIKDDFLKSYCDKYISGSGQ